MIKTLYEFFCRNISGIYKRKEKSVIIKKENQFDYSLLLVELLHSKSITQYYNETEDWITEGIPHFIATVICEKCKISRFKETNHIKSIWDKYFDVWIKLYKIYGLNFLKTIIYSKDIKITKALLKNAFSYPNEDILTISYKKAKELSELI